MPAWAATKETLLALQEHFCERLGHVLLWQAPWVFQTAYRMVAPLLDQRTMRKVVFLRGDWADGSKVALLLADLLGPDWRSLLNVDRPPVLRGAAQGYDHRLSWPRALEEFLTWRQGKVALGLPLADQVLAEEGGLRAEAARVGEGQLPPEPEGMVVQGPLRSGARLVPLEEEPKEEKKGWFW